MAEETILDFYYIEEQKASFLAKFDGRKGVKAAILDDELVMYGGEPYYHAVGRESLSETVEATRQARSAVGYVKKSVFDALNVTSVSIPENFAGLEAEMVPTRLMDQLFRIVEVVENEDYVEVTARHVWYDNLKDFTWWKPDNDESYTAAAVCRNVLENSGHVTASRVASDCTDEKPGSEFDYYNKNLVETFLDPENGICAKFGLSLIRYNWDFYCLKEVGYNRGFVIENGKNLLGVERTESIENVATRVAPYGKDDKGDYVWLNHEDSWYLDSQYIDEYSCPMIEMYDTGLQVGKGDVTAENIQEKLLAAGQKRFSEDHVDLPEVQMRIEFLSLGDTEEYVQYRNLDKVYLYDIVSIKDTIRGYNYTAQVIEVEHDVLTGMLLSITIGKLDNWDGTRKIATWQVPEIDGANIRLQSILAGSFEPGAIGAYDLQNDIIDYAHFKQATIDALTAGSITAVTAQIHEIIAGSITAADITAGSITTELLAAGAISTDKLAANSITSDKIQAGAITATEIASYAITAEKIGAGAITAGKLAAGSITASKIDTTDLAAINATLGTAQIADAQIANADISFAKVKDLDAQSAYFGQAVFQEAVGGKLYVPRLAVGYAQMLSATIGDLVIQASNDNYYKLDVDLAGNVTATQMTPTAEEIAHGYTDDGRTIYMGTDILATDLNTQNIYASHGLMDEITANIINVDKLFAREATIAKINALDLSSNTYIQSTVGNWQGQSTITQTVNSINTRISTLGYGTFFYSDTEPDPSGVVVGDVWIEPIDDNTWDDISAYTWEQLSEMTWEQVAGKYRMYVWTGTQWKLLFDNTIYNQLQTEIAQNAYAITLKADSSTVNTLSNDVSEFAATLEVQSQAITSAVSAVNAKTANYVQLTDPSQDSSISLSKGDIWMKSTGDGTWDDIADYTWDELADLEWNDLAGQKTYVWDGTKWILSNDFGETLNMRTEITQTAEEVDIHAQKIERIDGDIITTNARINVQADRITQEVSRATAAEATKITKTTKYQTADEIVQEAYRQSTNYAGDTFIQKTGIYQTAEDIKIEAVETAISEGNSTYIKRSGIYITPEAIVSSAVSQAKSNANSSYIMKTTTYQTAESIRNEAVRIAGEEAASAYIGKSGNYNTVNDLITKAQQEAESAATTAQNACIAKTETYQSAQAIVDTAVATAQNEAGSTYIKQTTSYQTADAIVNTAVSTAQSNATATFIQKTSSYQTADAIVLKAEEYADDAEAAAKGYTDSHAYAIQSGIEIKAAGVEISGSKYVKIKSGGSFLVDSGNFTIDSSGIVYTAGFVLENGWMYSGSGSNCVCINGSNPNQLASAWAIWAGADWPDAPPGSSTGYAPFRVKRDGTVIITKLLVQDPDDPTKTKNVDLFTNFTEAGRVKGWECVWNQSQSSGQLYCIVTAITNTGRFSSQFYAP